MLDANGTVFTNPSTFILLGIPGLEDAHIWISIPLCAMYILAVLGNFTILFIVRAEPSLHVPMSYFLCMLTATDLVLSTSTLRKMLGIFWFNSTEIEFNACMAQLYVIHSFTAVESGILVAMALDRYVAICDPLRHASILTSAAVIKVGLAALLRGALLLAPHPFLVRRWPYCRTNVIHHTYCEHMAVAKLACADIHINSYYSLFVIVLVTGMDGFCITLSYSLILRAVFRLPSSNARLKALSTCGSHISIILAFYIPALFSFLTHRFSHNIALHIHVIIANLYLLVPPMLNPIIYGVRTKQIRDQVLRVFTYEGT